MSARFLLPLLLAAAASAQGAVTLRPDYAGVTLPPNIAPLNFDLRGAPEGATVTLSNGTVSRDFGPRVRVPPRFWRELLQAPAYTITVRDGEATLLCATNTVAREAIDPVLAYRLIPPSYENYQGMGLWWRDLTTFREHPLYTNLQTSLTQCVNCHAFNQGDPDTLLPVVADCGDRALMRDLLMRGRPDFLLHAAAYKHVPMMERNPVEALRNNALATRTLAEEARAAGVGTFVLVSTDKAIRPISAMGVSKRLAEIFVRDLAGGPTRFCAVRFGNVLGSSGSVVPRFRAQIAKGGPVTVTDPRMERYFMTIAEASGLVLQAATFARGGEIFVLDMGKPMTIVSLAETMIRLSGLRPGRDIPIVFSGIRPGEKLAEELGVSAAHAERTGHARIFVGRIPQLPPEAVAKLLTRANNLSQRGLRLTVEDLRTLLNEEGTTP